MLIWVGSKVSLPQVAIILIQLNECDFIYFSDLCKVFKKYWKTSFKQSEFCLCIDSMMRPAHLCQRLLTQMKNISTWWTNEDVYEEHNICNTWLDQTTSGTMLTNLCFQMQKKTSLQYKKERKKNFFLNMRTK